VARYWLSRECYVCAVKGNVVVLNARDATYYQFRSSIGNELSAHIRDWPVVDPAHDLSVASESDSGGVLDVVNKLLAHGVLVSERRTGKDAVPIRVSPANVALMDEYEQVGVQASVGDLAKFIRAALSAGIVMRLGSKKAVMLRLKRHFSRRAPRPCREGTSTNDQIEKMRRTLALFRMLRPLLWQARHQEWFDRAVLLNLMRYGGVQPDWIFAVSVNPLCIHTWLQIEDFIIDDSPGLASTFVPIMQF
jgi:hypothetical protein